MINQNLQADNQNGQQEPQAVNQGARTDNGSARAEEVRDSAAMTEEPQAGAVAPAGTEQPEGEKAGRVNVPKTEKHRQGSYRERKEAYSAEYQARQAEKRAEERRARQMPRIDDEWAAAFVTDMAARLRGGTFPPGLFSSWQDSETGKEKEGARVMINPFWAEAIEQRIKDLGLAGRDADQMRFILRMLVALRPFIEARGQAGKPAPKRRGAGRKKAAPGTLPAYIPDFFAMMNREELAAIPQMIRTNPTRGAKISGLRAVVFEAEGVKLFQETGGAADLAGLAPDVALDQLLKMAVIGLTQNNHITDEPPKNPDALNLDINFSLADYARLKGYDMDIKPDKDPATEKRRISRIMQHVRKEAEEEGDRLMGAHLTFKRKGKNGAGTFEIYNIFAKFHIDDNNAVKCTFIKEAAVKILDAPLTWIPAALFRLNGNHPNAYKVACKADAYYFMDPNYGKPKAHILLVKTLLGYTDIKTPEEWEAQGQAWTCSRTAFERQLNKLKAEGFITGWRYCGVNGAELTPAEIDAIRTDKTKWQKARIWLDFPPLPADQGARIERKEKKRAERQKRKEKSELETMKKDVSGLKKTVYHRKKRQQGGNQ